MRQVFILWGENCYDNAGSGSFTSMPLTNTRTTTKSVNMNIEFGNAGKVDTAGSGWFIGFSDWTKSDKNYLRHVPFNADISSLCVKWFEHKKGNPNGEPKPISEGRTLSIMVSAAGSFRLEFAESPQFISDQFRSFTLRNHGDFVIWGSGLYHRAFGEEDSTIMTIRWLENATSSPFNLEACRNPNS